MDIQPQTQQSQSISDDQELAKVLAGVNGEAEEVADTESSDPIPVVPPTPMPPAPQAQAQAQAQNDDANGDDNQANDQKDDNQQQSQNDPGPMPSTPQAPVQTQPQTGGSSLDDIKQQALGELRPLVDKLDVSAEEKFDTYLLLIRSTDDKDLVAPAHAAAKSITDEARRAQALLDIIKEIDFLSNPQPSQS